MPSPEHLQAYEALHPGAAKLIFDEFEAQATHRRALEARVVSGSERRANVGQILGAILFAGAIGGGLWVAAFHNGVAGAGVSTAALGAGAIVYVVGGRPPTSG